MNLPKSLKRNRPLLLLFPFLLFLALTGYSFYENRIIEEGLFPGPVEAGGPLYQLYLYDLLSLAGAVLPSLLGIKLVIDLLKESRNQEKNAQEIENKNEILSIASHEIYAPLTNIKNTLYVVQPKLTEEYQKFSERAIDECQQLVKLIDDLLVISRFEMGKMKLNKQLSNISDICQEVVSEFKEQAERLKLSLEYEKPTKPLPLVSFDTDRIREVIVNFVSNGLKYTTKGGLKIKAEAKSNQLIVAVSDTGMGITPENVKKLFQRFVRLGNGQTNSAPGTGLGLYISRLIIEAHKGKIWVESASGRGSTFYFSLPLSL